VRACANWSLHKTVSTLSGNHVQVVLGNCGSNAGASPPSLQPVETPAAGTLEVSGEANELESGPVLGGTGISAIFHGDM